MDVRRELKGQHQEQMFAIKVAGLCYRQQQGGAILLLRIGRRGPACR